MKNLINIFSNLFNLSIPVLIIGLMIAIGVTGCAPRGCNVHLSKNCMAAYNAKQDIYGDYAQRFDVVNHVISQNI